jgi:hypothetical protein
MLTVGTMKIALSHVPAAEEVRSVEDLALARALEECLEALDRGETDLDELCGRYPEAQDEIRPLLEIAQQLGRQRGLSVPLSLEFWEGLRRLLSQRGAV